MRGVFSRVLSRVEECVDFGRGEGKSLEKRNV